MPECDQYAASEAPGTAGLPASLLAASTALSAIEEAVHQTDRKSVV